jgi:hypothetical protein
MTEPRYRIFAAVIPHGMGPPRPLPEQSSREFEPELPVVQRDCLLDSVSRILDAEPEPGESVQRSFDRKERELRAYCDQLDHEIRARLWSRLVAAETNDPIIAKLARLSTERRQRMLASLAETPRRRSR